MTTPIYIVYNAGYATADVPAALKQITSNIIKDCTKVVSGKLSTLMKSESLTNYSYTLSDSSTINEVVSNYSMELDFYRKKSI
jgi:translation elongation factor EF-Ts